MLSFTHSTSLRKFYIRLVITFEVIEKDGHNSETTFWFLISEAIVDQFGWLIFFSLPLIETAVSQNISQRYVLVQILAQNNNGS